MRELGGETSDPQVAVGVLNSIERDSAVTPWRLTGNLGIALGLANSYLRRCVRKGPVKIRQVPLNNYAHYLTPQGFAARSRLTAEYLAVSFNFFRRAQADCAELSEQSAARGWRGVALYGAGDRRGARALAGAEPLDSVILTDTEAKQQRLRRACRSRGLAAGACRRVHFARSLAVCRRGIGG